MPTSSQPTTPPGSPKQTWDADGIVVQRLQFSDDDNPEDHAKIQLRKECDNLSLDEVGEKFVYSNRQGYRVLEQLQDLQREMKNSQEKNKSRIEMLENEMTRLRLDVEGKWLQEEALVIRRRFIDHFKRDVLKLSEFQRTDAIKAGNEVAHHGNALSDAYLFKNDGRMDFQVYSRLYGFQFPQVLKYFNDGIDGGIFSILNAYSTLLMQTAQGKQISSELEQAFRNFISLAENSYPSAPMDDNNSKLAKSYWVFWHLYKQNKN